MRARLTRIFVSIDSVTSYNKSYNKSRGTRAITCRKEYGSFEWDITRYKGERKRDNYPVAIDNWQKENRELPFFNKTTILYISIRDIGQLK